MALESFLKTRHCLVWETERPFQDRPRESPVFTLMNSQWFLRITYRNVFSGIYEIFIVNNSGLKIFRCFDVTTYLEDVKSNSGPILWTKQFIFSAEQSLWYNYTDVILKSIPELETYGHFTIICVFHTSAESLLPIKTKAEHKSIQTSLDTSSTLENDSVVADTGNPSPSSSSVSLDSPLNLESLSQDLGKLLDKNLMPDLQLKNGDRTVPAHKAVLAARSEVFCAMFQHEMAERNSNIIDIKDIEPPVLDAFLKYLYSGKVPDDLAEDVVPKLYAAGDKYAVSALTKVCSDFMARNLSEENFLKFLTLADAHSDKELKEAVAVFVTKREVLLTSDIWMAFSKEHPILAIEIYQKHVEKTLSK